MKSLRFRVLLFVIPVVLYSLLFKQAFAPWLHGKLGIGIDVLFLSIIVGAIYIALTHVSQAIKYSTNSMSTASFQETEEKPFEKKLSDVEEIRHLLEASSQMKKDLAMARTELLENTKLAEIGASTSKVMHDMGMPLMKLNAVIAQLKPCETMHKNISDALENLNKAIKNIQTLNQDILLQYKNDPTKVEAFSAQTLLDDIIHSLQDTVLGKAVSWERNDLATLPTLTGSRSLLYRGISNIIKNGLEALYFFHVDPETDPLFEKKMTITTNLCDDSVFELHIKDNGPGIPLAHQEAILEGGFTTNKKNGHGLGILTSENFNILK